MRRSRGGTAPLGAFPPPANDDTTVSNITVSGLTASISDVNVNVQIDYPTSGHLQIRLVAPDGTAVLLASRNPSPTGGGNFFLDTRFDDQAFNTIATAPTPYGLVRPVSALSVLNGMSAAVANGTWQLQVKDEVTGATGTLLG